MVTGPVATQAIPRGPDLARRTGGGGHRRPGGRGALGLVDLRRLAPAVGHPQLVAGHHCAGRQLHP